MQSDFIGSISTIFFDILFSIQFGAFLIVLGSIIYTPTGNRIGKYCILIGLMIFTINALIIQ